MTRTEFRVVVERDGQQYPMSPPYDEPTVHEDAAVALLGRVTREGYRAFIVHRQVTVTPWVDDRGAVWDEQAALDARLEASMGGQG